MNINNESEWISFCKARYPGSPNWNPEKSPSVYPCQAQMDTVSGGIGGDWTAFQIRYQTGFAHAPYTPWETVLEA